MSRSRTKGSAAGMGLAARFALATSAGLAALMVLAGWLLLTKSQELVDRSVDQTLRVAVRAQSERMRSEDPGFLERSAKGDAKGGVGRFQATVRGGSFAGRSAHVYEQEGGASLLVPSAGGGSRDDLAGLVILVGVLVAGAGAVLAAVVAKTASQPLGALVDDVGTLARRGLRHSIRPHGPKEVVLLGRAISRMATDLLEAREAEVELGVRERERAVAREVSDALRPQATPDLPGWTVLESRIEGTEIGGGFHEYLTVGDRVVAVVCDVTGDGIPGALIGATARAFLRSAIEQEGDLVRGLIRANRDLHRDVRRGLAVTAICVAFEPGSGEVEIACAGHRVPAHTWTQATGSLASLQPEGIALGFDSGPVFERRLTSTRHALEPGDSFVLCSQGLVEQPDTGGHEWGLDALEASAAQHLARGSFDAITGILDDAEEHSRGVDREDPSNPIPDATLIVLTREPT